jgi:hypothetical protein
MKVENIVPRPGQHCETTALGTLLGSAGLVLSEPMLFGIGEGLAFLYWDMKALEFPMVLGRTKPMEITHRLAANLKLDLQVDETASARKAFDNVVNALEAGAPVGLKLDSYHLDYFAEKVHFAAHVVVLYGIERDRALLVDTRRAGGCVTTSLDSLRLARAAKGPMASKNLSFTIRPGRRVAPIETAVRHAIVNTARSYLAPPIRKMSHTGILVLADKIGTWFERTSRPEYHLPLTALLMETAGTGGSLFRNIYRDFLREAAELLEEPAVERASRRFGEAADLWKQVIDVIEGAGARRDAGSLAAARPVLQRIASIEEGTMQELRRALA